MLLRVPLKAGRSNLKLLPEKYEIAASSRFA